NMVTHAGQVANATAANQHDGVFLQVVAFARDVGRHLDAVGQPHAGNLAERRVGLLGRHDLYLQADTPFLRAAVQGRMLRPAILLDARFADQLVDGRHQFSWVSPGKTITLLTRRGLVKRSLTVSRRAGRAPAVALVAGGRSLELDRSR